MNKISYNKHFNNINDKQQIQTNQTKQVYNIKIPTTESKLKLQQKTQLNCVNKLLFWIATSLIQLSNNLKHNTVIFISNNQLFLT